MVPGVSAPSSRPALPQLLQTAGQFKHWAVLGPLRRLPLPRPGHPPASLPTPRRPPGAPLTTLLIAVVATIIVAIAMPQAADAVAVLAGKLVLLTLPGGCGHSGQAAAGRGGEGGQRPDWWGRAAPTLP